MMNLGDRLSNRDDDGYRRSAQTITKICSDIVYFRQSKSQKVDI
jgi:hypothetical protein